MGVPSLPEQDMIVCLCSLWIPSSQPKLSILSLPPAYLSSTGFALIGLVDDNGSKL
jgi:hypothetical protein